MLNFYWFFERPIKTLLRFFSNSAINTGRGFRARWEIGCGGFFDKPGKISSPYFPNPFPIQKSCSYLIQAPKDDFVSLGRVSSRYLKPIKFFNFLVADWLKLVLRIYNIRPRWRNKWLQRNIRQSI